MPGKNLGNFQAHRFPENLGSAEVPNYITFRPQKVIYGQTNVQRPDAVGKAPKNTDEGRGPFGKLSAQIGGTIRGISDAAGESLNEVTDIFKASSFKSFTTKLGKVVKGKVRIGDFILSAGLEVDTDKLYDEGSISLYLPQSLGAEIGIDYSATDLGAAGVGALGEVAKLTGSGQASIEGLVEGLLGGSATDILSSGKARDLNAVSTGKVGNPFSYQIFNGVQHRTFTYEFTLISKNPSESRKIKNIVDLFFYYMLPGRGEDIGKKEGDQTFHFLEIPVQWKIEYLRKGNPLEFHEQPNACFLQSANVTYGGDAGNNTHSDGSPIQTTLSLGFVEIEPLYREKIGSYGGTNFNGKFPAPKVSNGDNNK